MIRGDKMRKFVVVTQSFSDITKGKKYSPAFESYIQKLKPTDKLPRGKYFKNRVGGIQKTLGFHDEFLAFTDNQKIAKAMAFARGL